jgi:hypothetical protein
MSAFAPLLGDKRMSAGSAKPIYEDTAEGANSIERFHRSSSRSRSSFLQTTPAPRSITPLGFKGRIAIALIRMLCRMPIRTWCDVPGVCN